MNLGLQNKQALVFGGSRGIGYGVAKVLAQEGARVTLAARDENTLKKAAQGIGAQDYQCVDLHQPNAAAQAVASHLQKHSSLDILVLNSGGPKKSTFSELHANDWQKSFQELWLSATAAIDKALPSMRRNSFGRIIWITSSVAKEPLPELTLSSGLRAGILGLIKSLSREVAAAGITVNAILPGATNTERLKDLGWDLQKTIANIPAGRLGEVDEVGSLAAYLASTQAAFLTGQAITIDGGRSHAI